jgi:hypothetical protein
MTLPDTGNLRITNVQEAGFPRVGVMAAAAAQNDTYGLAEINASETAGRTAVASGDGTLGSVQTVVENLIGELQNAGILAMP